ncbi:hypothetical protein JL09_g3037 [Pichia kudriavzevii]|uniref:peptide-methionine (S)-S-oxide reductase n=1 Tax=Pichia kudriavzevii TaxID=4909 RepID=A0A099NY87_PICKU|nr:hypothetical protein JL09_g3037 [Pichia kudriavzevii]
MASNIVSKIKTTESSQLAAFAAGCFWGVEHIFRKHFNVPDQIVDIKVGYANGKEDIHSPSYKAVCTGATNFAEAVLVSYEPSRVSYKELTEFFFRIHDPTTLNSQGPDVGTQYRSGIYYTTPEQQDVAQRVKDVFQREWYKDSKIVTNIEPLKSFYDAEEYHQLYLHVNKDGYTLGMQRQRRRSFSILQAVCTGATNFAEAVLVSYEPSRVSYKELTEFFFRIHDPTTLNSQGHNVGTQYRSGIYYTTPEQQDVAQRVKDVFQREWYKTTPIVTEIQPLKNFYDAEEYHQMYLDVNNLNLNCAAHYLRDRP